MLTTCKQKLGTAPVNTVVSNHVNSDYVPSFHVLTSEMLGRLLPVFTLLHIIVVEAVDYKQL